MERIQRASSCFEENGEPKPPYGLVSIGAQLEWIEVEDTPPRGDDGPMIEPVGTRLEEIVLKYRPEE